MPVPGKEIERQVLTPDQIAVREVENYIEKVERQVETQVKPQQQQAPQNQQSQAAQNVGKVAALQVTVAKQKINLPLSQEEVQSGLHSKITEGVRWLSEWCVMMIKKYPGRVFYLPTKPNGQ